MALLKILLGTVLSLPIYMGLVYLISKITGKIFLDSFAVAGFIGFIVIFATGLLLSEENLTKLRSSKN